LLTKVLRAANSHSFSLGSLRPDMQHHNTHDYRGSCNAHYLHNIDLTAENANVDNNFSNRNRPPYQYACSTPARRCRICARLDTPRNKQTSYQQTGSSANNKHAESVRLSERGEYILMPYFKISLGLKLTCLVRVVGPRTPPSRPASVETPCSTRIIGKQ
jgi:hypothetical protein